MLFYYDTEINLDLPGQDTLGLTLTNFDWTTNRRWIEIFFNATSLQRHSSDVEAYVFNHELLHALGLEHTFDDSDGDFYLSTDPQLSATTSETVMSYIPPASGIYPTDLTHNDYQALIQIWGPATENSPTVDSTSVYRLFQPSASKHLFSSNSSEIDILTGLSQVEPFINEGIAYVVGPGANQELYRFYHPSTSRHFYSANTYERDLIIANSSSGYIYEGVAYNVFSNDSSHTDRSAVVRFYDPVGATHFYTASMQEQSILQFTHPDWVNEGVAWYV